MVKAGSFREDLFYRLSVFPVEIPPLRDRRQDLPDLVDFLLRQLSSPAEGHQYAISKKALIKLMGHLWPGNIRELRNCLQLATGLCENDIIEENHIIIMRRSSRVSGSQAPENLDTELTAQSAQMDPLEQIEANFLNSLIAKYNGNRKLMAAELNVSERTLYRKLNRLNLI
jgi:DNA-binding NtrC family response regulator